ncbi:hypothetical protein [Streptosporangium sp. NPDC000509]|uniref:hypothetical protein n=1 Tax=Streptosporangium sp. NPDC000509 TaxID=3366186 RepID=UPI0036C94045
MTRFQVVTGSRAGEALNLRVGETVEVLGEAEIMATLDEKGELDRLPFMPEMLAFCGRRLTVHKVAHKLCDTIGGSGMRRMERAVHLSGARCDGQAHGGCQTACQFYWKEAWLKRVDPTSSASDSPVPTSLTPTSPIPDPSSVASSAAFVGENGLAAGRPLLPILQAATRKEPGPDGEERFSCQATELLRAAPTCLPFKDVRQYVTDVRSGNVGVPWMLRSFLVGLFNRFQQVAKRVLPRWMWIKGGMRWGFVRGEAGRTTPTLSLDLRPGELVRVKSKEEILKTLNDDLLNRGMGFEEEMSRYCGHVARVSARVEKCLDEKTGRMLRMKNPCIILDGVICAGAYNVSCPREFVPFWREIWLERVEEPG